MACDCHCCEGSARGHYFCMQACCDLSRDLPLLGQNFPPESIDRYLSDQGDSSLPRIKHFKGSVKRRLLTKLAATCLALIHDTHFFRRPGTRALMGIHIVRRRESFEGLPDEDLFQPIPVVRRQVARTCGFVMHWLV